MENQPGPQPPSQEQQKHRHAPITVCDLLSGQSGIVSQLKGEKEVMNRIAGLGFTTGARVTVLNNQGRGPLIVSILGAHIALGRREAGLIQVQPL